MLPLNRTELIEAVAALAGSDPAVARRHVDAVFETIMDRVTAGERVLVTGFGTFDKLSRPARTARNPRTGEPVEVPPTETPRFRAGQTFKDRVAGHAAVISIELSEPDPLPEPEPLPKPAKGKKSKKKKKKKDAASLSAGEPKKSKKKSGKSDKKGKGKKAAKAH